MTTLIGIIASNREKLGGSASVPEHLAPEYIRTESFTTSAANLNPWSYELVMTSPPANGNLLIAAISGGDECEPAAGGVWQPSGFTEITRNHITGGAGVENHLALAWGIGDGVRDSFTFNWTKARYGCCGAIFEFSNAEYSEIGPVRNATGDYAAIGGFSSSSSSGLGLYVFGGSVPGSGWYKPSFENSYLTPMHQIYTEVTRNTIGGTGGGVLIAGLAPNFNGDFLPTYYRRTTNSYYHSVIVKLDSVVDGAYLTVNEDLAASNNGLIEFTGIGGNLDLETSGSLELETSGYLELETN